MELSAIIFDLDDTLYDESAYVDQALAHIAAYLAERVCQPITDDRRDAVGNERSKGGGDLQAMDKLAQRYHARMCELLAQYGRGKIFDLLCEEEHLTVPIADLVAAYRATQPRLTLYPDAEELLRALTAAHIQTAVITDGCAAVQHAKLRALRLDERTDYCLVTDEFGLSKPDPEVYTRVLTALACPADHAAYIGDNPHKDFAGAKALGLHTFRIVRSTGMHMTDTVPAELEAEFTIHSLTELQSYLNH